jgi:homoserine dehydrogenase
MHKKALAVGIAGLGTVGSGVVSLLQRRRALYAERTGTDVFIETVSARDRDRDRPCDVSSYRWTDDPVAMASDGAVDVVVEAVGGEDGTAYALCRAALENGKHVVTANKALIAARGAELARIAEDNGLALAFEGAVGGGIPLLKTVREGLAANEMTRVAGILNGTCNYILSAMENGGGNFDAALRAAQEKGYAEADPHTDVEGIDAAHKLAVLSALCFGLLPSMEGIRYEGVRRLKPVDFAAARLFGCTIRLLAVAERGADGAVFRAVYPALVNLSHGFACVTEAGNAVRIEGDAVGSLFLQGPGAGMFETASAVVADILDVAAGRRSYPFSVPVRRCIAPSPPASPRETAYFLCISLAAGHQAEDVVAAFAGLGVQMGAVKTLSREGVPYVACLTERAEEGKVPAAAESVLGEDAESGTEYAVLRAE